MQMDKKRITESGKYIFGDNYVLIFEEKYIFNKSIDNCNIECGDNCITNCVSHCITNCGSHCIITCRSNCNINCGNDCNIDYGRECYIKAGEGTQLIEYKNLLKTISKGEEFIWWYINYYGILIKTYQDVNWQINNPEKFKELYPFVHNELDSATLF